MSGLSNGPLPNCPKPDWIDPFAPLTIFCHKVGKLPSPLPVKDALSTVVTEQPTGRPDCRECGNAQLMTLAGVSMRAATSRPLGAADSAATLGPWKILLLDHGPVSPPKPSSRSRAPLIVRRTALPFCARRSLKGSTRQPNSLTPPT